MGYTIHEKAHVVLPEYMVWGARWLGIERPLQLRGIELEHDLVCASPFTN
jgi:hypothetical protein